MNTYFVFRRDEEKKNQESGTGLQLRTLQKVRTLSLFAEAKNHSKRTIRWHRRTWSTPNDWRFPIRPRPADSRASRVIRTGGVAGSAWACVEWTLDLSSGRSHRDAA